MSGFLGRLTKAAGAVLAGIVIVAALLSVAARIWLPHADGLRTMLLERLTETLGTEVEVGSLSIRLRGLNPTLAFTDARLLAPDATVSSRTLLAAQGLQVDLDLLATLAAGKPRVDAVTLVGAEIHVVREGDGRLRIVGLDAMQGNDAAALDFFMREGRFRLTESRLTWRDAGNPRPAEGFQIEVAEIDNSGHEHRLRLRARPDNDPSGEVQILGIFEGPAETLGLWSGRVYLHWLGTDLGAFANAVTPAQLALRSERFDVETWNRLSGGRLLESRSQVAILGLSLTNRDRQHRLDLGELSGAGRWRRPDPQSKDWQLEIVDLRLPGAARAATTSARARYDAPAPARGADSVGRAELFAAIGRVQIGPAAELLRLVAPDLPDAVERLANGRLRGLVRNLAVNLALEEAPPGEPDRPDGATGNSQPPRPLPLVSDWRLHGEVRGLRVQAGADLPPFSGLDIVADAGPRGGTLSVAASDASLDLQPLFAQPHRSIRIGGKLAWRLMPAGSIHLWSRALSADTQDFETISRLEMCVHPSGANPSVNLHTHIRNGRVDALQRWLPVGIMDQRLRDWLQRSIVDGRLESADLLLRGPLEHFPFDDQQGRFILVLRAVDGVLDYGPTAPAPAAQPGLRDAAPGPELQWPPLRDLAATLRFENRSLEISVSGAEMLNSRIDRGRALLSNLWQPRYLEIEAAGEGPLADGKHVLGTSPLAPKLGGLASAVDVSGSARLALELGVPLSRGLPFQYRGTLTMDPEPPASDDPQTTRTLSIRGTDLRFADIVGELGFDPSGVYADSIQARLGRQPLAVDVETRDSGGGEARTEIGLRARTAAPRLESIIGPTLGRLVEGDLDWRLMLTLSNRDASQPNPPIDFTLTSDLRGLGVTTPAPLGKRREAARPMRASGRYQDQWPLPVQFRYGELGALLELDRGRDGAIALQRATVDLTGEPTTLPPAGSIRIGGRLKRLNLTAWLDWFANNGSTARASTDPAAQLRLLPLELRIDALDIGTLRLSDVEAQLTPEADTAWTVGFSSAQTGTGSVALPPRNAEQLTGIRLDRFDLKPLTETSPADKAPATKTQHADPRRFANLDLEIDSLHFGDNALGRLRILSAPRPNGVRFSEISLRGPLVTATGSGDWTIDPTDYVESRLELSAKSDAIGELLRETGIYSALSGAPGNLGLDLSWPGGPTNFSLEQTRGTLTLGVGAGRMLDMEPGVGRMLGILNTGALSRRLSLDFSDVFEDGFGFDKITGVFALNRGEARIRQLSIVSPPADIKITGRTDLVDGELDQRVEVTPKIGTGLAVAGAVAGGPVVGAAVFLADKVTDGGFERLGRYAYSVKGPWRDPVITRVGTSGAPAVGDLFVDQSSRPEAASSPQDAAAKKTPAAAAERTRPAPKPNPFLEDF